MTEFDFLVLLHSLLCVLHGHANAAIATATSHSTYDLCISLLLPCRSPHCATDGKKAMKKLDGYPYGHLILKVEWAKPSTNRPQNSMRFATGYGGALPQDKERQQNK